MLLTATTTTTTTTTTDITNITTTIQAEGRLRAGIGREAACAGASAGQIANVRQIANVMRAATAVGGKAPTAVTCNTQRYTAPFKYRKAREERRRAHLKRMLDVSWLPHMRSRSGACKAHYNGKGKGSNCIDRRTRGKEHRVYKTK